MQQKIMFLTSAKEEQFLEILIQLTDFHKNYEGRKGEPEHRGSASSQKNKLDYIVLFPFKDGAISLTASKDSCWRIVAKVLGNNKSYIQKLYDDFLSYTKEKHWS